MLCTPEPAFNSNITNLLFELEGLRDRSVTGTTPSWEFYQLKNLFHIVEALSSARIEGNHTTLASFVEKRLSNEDTRNEKLIEISNLIEALEFIDEHIGSTDIDKDFIFELHKIVVKNLSNDDEGDSRPGAYRTEQRFISQSDHVLPQPSDIRDHMDELFNYINENTDRRLDLLKIAIVHHRFVWVHPFGNGNGRVVRLLTYAMLCKKGFIKAGSARLFNPTAVFSGNRQEYYKKLSIADRGGDEDILEWAEYVISGLKEEIDKSQKLTNAEFVQDEILIPTIAWAQNRNILNDLETKVLNRLVRKNTIKASDIRDLWPSNLSHVIVSKFLRKMKEQNFIEPLTPNGREYIIKFTESKLTRGILDQMEKQGMLPIKVDEVSGVRAG
jgi:Fic family protein